MIILASASPRRKELLSVLFDEFITDSSKVEEHIPNCESIENIVMDLAKTKARDVAGRHTDKDIIIGADTIVYLENEILGKPKTKEEAKKMLRKLSNKTHDVLTGVCIVKNNCEKIFHERTRVTFCELTENEIDEYVKSGEPLDKAGSYGIQGKGSKFVKGIEGDYFNVVGLPLHRLYEELKNV